MGNVLNWNMPIEWSDGTGAWLDPAFKISPTTDLFMVRSSREPDGWNRGYMPRLSATSSIMVNPDGSLDCARGSRDPRIQNVEMPLLRFSDGTEPVRGTITKDGSLLTLEHTDGSEHSYIWPKLIAQRGAMKLREITIAEVKAEEKRAEEVAVMQENPLFGMF